MPKNRRGLSQHRRLDLAMTGHDQVGSIAVRAIDLDRERAHLRQASRIGMDAGDNPGARGGAMKHQETHDTTSLRTVVPHAAWPIINPGKSSAVFSSSPHEPTGRRKAPPDDKLRGMREHTAIE